MPYREHLPSPALAAYVTCFWENHTDGTPQRILPDGAMDIVFDVRTAEATVIGPMTTALVTDASDAGLVVGVRFRPGAARELLGIAAREVRDDAAPLADVWGAEGRAITERLASAGRSSRSVLVRLERTLTSRISRIAEPEPRLAEAIATLERAGGELPLGAIASRVALGERQLERLFDERVGLGPKAFGRIVRMRRAARAIGDGGSSASWARIAVECGYADQAHLIRDFRALVGVTPAAFARARETPSSGDRTSNG